jgi:ABC-type antimicrobial peptide transport system permease subunit
MVLREALMLTAAGLAVGLPSALIVLRLSAAKIVGLSHPDAMAFAGATAAMLVVAVVAAAVPALRASHVDPVVALRQE